MRLPCSIVALALLHPGVEAATVNFVQNAVNDVNAGSIAAVDSNQYLETSASYSTVTAPASWSGHRFTHWSNTSYPAKVYRDAWGRSLNPISFVLLEDTTCTAHYLPVALDSDGDGVPDWFEMEYIGQLGNAAAADPDEDGISMLQESQAGTHPLYADTRLAGGVAFADSGMVTVNLGGFSRYTLRSEPAGTVDQISVAEAGSKITTPDLAANAAFGYWTLDSFRQQDAWGVALPQISFTMGGEDREAVAYLFAGDTDADGLPDAYEQYFHGTLANGAASDTDADGISLLAESSGGTSPLYGDSHQAGGVSWSDSAQVTVNLAGFSRYTLSSVPAGTVDQSAVVSDGTVITTPEMTQATFGYWTLDGMRQLDAWGTALRQITFTVDGTDRAAAAYLFAADSDGDGINDGFEQFHFGNLAQGANSDADGDGIPLLTEFNGGSNPLYGNAHQEGGVAWADSAMVVANLQPFERLSRIQVEDVLTDFFSPDPDVITGVQYGPWSAMAVTDWDGDGDLDLFVAHERGLRVFRNIGTARNPNFEEVGSGFGGLRTYLTFRDRPSLAGGDWNGDGFGDLVVGGDTDTLRLIASDGSFSSDGSGPNFVVASTTTSPALGDMNGDGKMDLLVLLDDGTVSLFSNQGSSPPFVGAGSANFLGTPAPEGRSIAIGDINQDGLPDVLLADGDGRIWEFLNNGSGGFSLQSKVWGGSYPGFATGLTLAAADLEGDGDLDLIAGLASGGLIALRDPGVGRPTGLVARPGANSVQLDWDASWQSRIRGYHVYRATAPVGPWNKLLADYVPLPGYLDSPVDPSVLNYYQVTGVSYFYLPGNSSPRVVESLPSDPAAAVAGKVILSMKPARGNPGKRIKLNLSVENATGVSGTGMQLRVAYDPTKLLPWAQADPGEPTVLDTGLSRNLAFTDNGTTSTGELVISGSGGGLEPGSGKLFTLQFEVAATVPKKTTLGVTITSATMRDLNGNLLGIEILPSEEPESDDVFIEGDLTGDGLVTIADKTLLKDLIKPNSRPATAEELMAGDLNGDGKLNVKDLVLMIQLLAAP